MRRFAFGLGTLLLSGCTHFTATSSTTSSGTSTSAGSGGASTSSTGTGTGGAAPIATISVVDDIGGPVSGQVVVVSDPAGMVVATLKTDATGKTTSTLPMNGMVSALLPSPTAPTAIAYASPPVAGPIRFVVARSLQANTPKTFALSYTGTSNKVVFFASCAPVGLVATPTGSAGAASLANYIGCGGKNTFDVGAVALDASGNVTAAKVETGHAFGSPIVNAFDLTTAAGQSVSATGTAMNIPPTAVNYRFDVRGRNGGSDLFEQDATNAFTAGSKPMLTGSVSMPAATGMFDELDTLQVVDDGTMSSWGQLSHATTLPVSAMWTANQTAAPTDPASKPDLIKQKVGYALGAGTPGDVVVLTIFQTVPNGTGRVWTVFAPPDATGTFTLPTLSAPYTDENLQFTQTTVTTVDTKLDMGAGFDAFAAAGADAQFRTPAPPPMPPMPPSPYPLPYPVIGYGTFAGMQRVYPAQ